METEMERYTNTKRTVWYIVMAMSLMLLALLGMQYREKTRLQQGIAEKVLRFHVRANSDSEEDQRLKLAVRDAVGEELAVRFSGIDTREGCEIIAREALDEIAETAERVVEAEGYDYPVEVFIDDVDFPVKTYGSYTFPAGNYRALEVVIGEGEGQNWWCVMYPNMCFSGSVYEVVDEEAGEELREVLSPEEYEKVLSSGDYELKFRYLPFLDKLAGDLR